MGNDTADEIIRDYTVADEASRLPTGWFRLEYARTQEIFRRLPPAPAKVLDLGGAAGHVRAGWPCAARLSVALCRLSFPGYADLPERKQCYSRVRS